MANKSAIESILLSRDGYSEVNKLSKYLSTLIIKNESEANDYETDYSYNNYSAYEASYSKSNSIYVFRYSEKDLQQFFPKDVILKKNLLDPDVINKMILENNRDALSFIEFLQTRFIENYIEYNQYYRQFLGQPKDLEDRIAVPDLDSGIEGDYIALHEIKQKTNPITYEYYFIKRNIETEIEKYPDLDYLKFIESPISPYLLRKSPDFTIFYSNDGLLDEDELVRFKKAYNKARIYVSEQLYCYGMGRRFPIYGNLMLLLILYYTMENYFNLKLEDYSLRKYSRYDIYDILESNGLKNLTKISDLNLLRKIVMQMDELNQYKGTEKVLKMIFKILDDKSVTVKRFNLVKDYRTSLTGELEFDTSKLYKDSVGLKFVEEPIAIDESNKIENAYEKKYTEYDAKTYFDDLWGGIDKNMDETSKRKIKDDIKNKLIQYDFNTLKTKYLSVSKSINMIEKSLDTMNVFYLVLKYHYDYEPIKEGNPFKDETINYSGIEVRGIDLFAAMCYLNNVMNKLDNPWEITLDRNFISSVHLLRSNSVLNSQMQEIKNNEIDIGNPILNKKLGDLFTDEELKTYLTSYNLTSFSSIADVLNDYEKNKEVFNLLKEKMAKEENKLMYEGFLRLENLNKGLYDFRYLFEGETDYRELFKKSNPFLLDYLENLILQSKSPDLPDPSVVLYQPLENLTIKLEEFINKILDGKKYFSFSTEREDERYLNDLKILMNEFLSIFTELYAIEKVIEIDDTPENILKFLYLEISRIIKDKFYDKLSFNYHLIKFLFKDRFKDNISFTEALKILVKGNWMDEISFQYILLDSYIGTSFYDTMSYYYELKSLKYKNVFSSALSYQYKLLDFKHND